MNFSGIGFKLAGLTGELPFFYSSKIKKKLVTELAGKKIYFKKKILSTQDQIKILAQNNAPEGTVVVAKEQVKGKGRAGKAWVSPPGGVYLSCLFKPKNISSRDISRVSLAMSVACRKALEKQNCPGVLLKWPNDLYLGKKKAGGILCEADIQGSKVNFLAVGIGINVNTKKLPPEAISLRLFFGKKFSEIALIREVLYQTEKYYLKIEQNQFTELLADFKKHCFLWGNQVKVDLGKEVIEAKAEGIDVNGYLVLRKKDGLIVTVSSGQVNKLSV